MKSLQHMLPNFPTRSRAFSSLLRRRVKKCRAELTKNGKTSGVSQPASVLSGHDCFFFVFFFVSNSRLNDTLLEKHKSNQNG